MLNDKQKEAVDYINGPCLVMAGAGSGKTRVLTFRISNMIEKGIEPSNILAITFTNKAAKEMKERVKLLVNNSSLFIGTFHSFGLKIIRENLNFFHFNYNLSILDSDDSLSAIKKIMKENDIDSKQISPGYVRNRISNIKNEMLTDEAISVLFNTPIEKIVVKIFHLYEEYIHSNNSVDFDDLIYLPVKLFINDPERLEHYQEKYKYILIDEYQDTNESQYMLTKLLANKYQNLFVVGDADQSIYSFRSANYQNILNFEKDFKNAKVIMLEENYRSTKNILNVANSVIKNNIERKEKNLWSSNEDGLKVKYIRSYDGSHEVKLIIDEIKKLTEQGIKKNDIAILYRTNGQSRLVEEKFLGAGIPYKVVGSYYFYARKEIKDLIAYLRLINNRQDDISLRRIINVPKRKIGDKTIENLAKKSKENNMSIFDYIHSGKELEFKRLIENLGTSASKLSLSELIDEILEKSGMLQEYKDLNTPEGDSKIENLMEFKSISASFEERTGSVDLNDFLEEVALISDLSEHKNNGDEITLMTLHSAKGLEFDVVFIVGMEEGILPHFNSMNSNSEIEEERRLCYVGITRAKKILYLTNAKRRILYGKETANPESRFIKEIDDSLLELNNNSITITEKEKIDKSAFYDEVPSEFYKGDCVRHEKYGRGVIIDLDNSYLTIAFSHGNGVKKIMRNHKSITKE